MGAIILFILKLLLYILLGIIGLILFLILIVLFIPIAYKAKGSKMEKIKAEVVVSWLLRIISVKIKFDDGETNVLIKLFGIPIKRTSTKDEPDESEIKEQKEDKTTEEKIIKNKDNKQKQKATRKDEKLKEEPTKTETVKNDLNKPKETIIKEKEIKKAGEKKSELKEEVKKIKDLKAKDKKTQQDKEVKAKKVKRDKKRTKKSEDNDKTNIIDTIKKAKNFITEEKNKRVIKKILSKVFKIIKHVLPNKYDIRLIIGNEDPATTGYMVGTLSIFYCFAGNNIKIVPDFENPGYRGQFLAKGKIYNVVILKHMLSLVLDKEVMKFIKEVRSLGG